MPDTSIGGRRGGQDRTDAALRPAPPAPEVPTSSFWSYTATTFLSALLLFSVQPMFAKMVLPVLGGSPSVWAVAIFFFQAALLVGYCYAHLLIAKAPPRADRRHPSRRLRCWRFSRCRSACRRPGASRRPASPTCGSSGCSRWRSACRSSPSRPTRRCCRPGSPAPGIRTAHDPYFLYAASNLGSLIALLGYPFMLEPAFGLKALSRLWALRLPAADGGARRLSSC